MRGYCRCRLSVRCKWEKYLRDTGTTLRGLHASGIGSQPPGRTEKYTCQRGTDRGKSKKNDQKATGKKQRKRERKRERAAHHCQSSQPTPFWELPAKSGWLHSTSRAALWTGVSTHQERVASRLAGGVVCCGGKKSRKGRQKRERKD